MAYLDVNFEKKDIEWKWADNSILDHISEHTAPRDIFDAVCYEISRY